MKSIVVAFSSLVVLAAAAPALADQCAWTSAKQAAAAKAIFKKGARYATFCKPCGERVPKGPFVVQTVAQRSPQRGYVETYVNRQPVDLAYVYIQTGPNVFTNVARLAKCPASDVPPVVSFKLKLPFAGQSKQGR